MGSKNGIKSWITCFSIDLDQNPSKMESSHLKLAFDHQDVRHYNLNLWKVPKQNTLKWYSEVNQPKHY
jgi:hypothetical protein